MGKKILWHQMFLFLILGGLTLLRLLSGQVRVDLNLVWWWLGGMVGFLFVFSDRLIYSVVGGRREVMRSAVFVVIWAVLAIFTATSVGNSFPRGLVLGLGTHLVSGFFWDHHDGGREFESWFWQARNINKAEMDWFFRGSLGFYFLIIWFL